jgi:hypothetical protein
MTEEIARIVKILGVNCSEIIIDIKLDKIEVNTIEVRDKKILLHSFLGNIDIEIPFSEISESDQKTIYKILKELLYN